MERIKQALERAKQEHAQLGAAPLSQVAGAKPGRIPHITYTQTQVCAISAKQLDEHRVISAQSRADVVAGYKMLRTQILQRMATQGWNTLGITSTAAGQGKTLTAINLAISLARDEQRTVLLGDLDMYRPKVHECFGYSPTFGIGDYFENDVPLERILFNPGINRLVILPGKGPIPHSSEILASLKMVRLVREMKARYASRFVMFDLPPVLSGDDVLAFAPQIDAFLIVIEDCGTEKDELTQTVELLKGSTILGTVLNKSSETVRAYYY
ncbi:MAG: CpsD/CapB family tyrosine-protein kinase [Gammaproteobacteria bacterium]